MIATDKPRRLFCFGLGYTGTRLAEALLADGWQVAGTCRSEETRVALAARGVEARLFDRDRPLADGADALAGATHLLSTAPPDESGDPVLDCHADAIARAEDLEWIGYLSTTAVYGDHRGLWVDEDTPPAPSSERGERRFAAETLWFNYWWGHGIPVQVFRLAGIYGPGRDPFDAVRAGTAKRIDKPGQVFSRIHVDDIVAVLRASIARPNGGRVYNVCDDCPAPPAEVVAYACELLSVAPPPLVPYDEAGLSTMAQNFYADNKRVRNDRIKDELGVALRYPDYKTGLKALLATADRPRA
ncbi:MAG: SDR family oxidoreductase [Alphaproteobacteria bacterium]